MKTIDPANLSALMDGELSPERAAEVRAELQRNPNLAAEFARLRTFDARCRTAAPGAAFAPTAGLPSRRRFPLMPVALAPVLVVLALLRFHPHSVESRLLPVAINAVAFGILLAWLIPQIVERPRSRAPKRIV